ncbi:MAG TPA: DUF2919 family protein [Steroidobacteraceae bacterium]|jgi:hypothetical protein
MLRHQTASSYPESAYDGYLCLKPPPLVWVVVLYLTRELTLPFIMGAAHVAGVGGAAIAALRSVWSPDVAVLVPALLGAPLLIVLFRRVPKAGGVVRWVWSHGKAFLACAAISDFFIAGIRVIWAGEINDTAVLQGIGAAADLCCLLYVLFSSRAHDAFADFPLPL